MRLTRPQMFMEIAHIVAKRSTCFRLNVGALVVVDNRIVSIGYNGRPPGEPHCTGISCPGAGRCEETIHAEMNALNYVPYELRNAEKDIYVTDSPCEGCAREIVKYRVKRLFFSKPYRLTSGLDFLIQNGVYVYQAMPAGYLLLWPDKEMIDGSTF